MSPVLTGRFVITETEAREILDKGLKGKPQASQISSSTLLFLHHKWFHTHVCVDTANTMALSSVPSNRHPLLTPQAKSPGGPSLGGINLVMGRMSGKDA